LRAGTAAVVKHPFTFVYGNDATWPYTLTDFESSRNSLNLTLKFRRSDDTDTSTREVAVDFWMPESWLSPEDRRFAAEAKAKKDAEEAARQKRLAAEQKRRDLELNKRITNERAKAAEQRRKVQVACAVIYQNTANKRLTDLTVKEEQEVRLCQALGFYHP
jgi:hypothetical protein